MKHVAGFAVWAGQPGGADEYRVAGVGLTHGVGQAKANADVIAAVPELLEALQTCVALFDLHDDCDDLDTTYAARQSARAIIAKATGGAA